MRISDWSSDVCSSDLVVGSSRYENDDFSPYDYQAIASAGYGHKFIENERTRLITEVGPGFLRALDAETGEVENGVVGRGLFDFKHQLTVNTAIYNAYLAESGSDNTFLPSDIAIAVSNKQKVA